MPVQDANKKKSTPKTTRAPKAEKTVAAVEGARTVSTTTVRKKSAKTEGANAGAANTNKTVARTARRATGNTVPRSHKLSKAKILQRVDKILDSLDRNYPDAVCSLNYRDAFQLLISTILAAQCTDKRVNEVTKDLFKKYPNPSAFATADPRELEEDIKPTGFFRNKARNIIQCCQELVAKHGGEVPHTMEELTALAGVGRKTANVVLGDAYGIPGVVVDTHAKRLSQRLGLTREEDPVKIEFDLMKVIPEGKWTKFCHQLIDHGRAICTARNPKCELCELNTDCEYPSMKGE